MIITVTLNPAMDETLVLDSLRPGETNRAQSSRTDPGGKGINVSRVLRELSSETLAMGFVSGAVGRFIEASLNEIGIIDDFIHTPGQTRINVVVVEREKDLYMTISAPGPETAPKYLDELKRRMRRRLAPGVWVVLAGSIPPYLPDSTYADLIDLVHTHGATPVLDTSGPALALGVEKKPLFIKPNRRELGDIVGRKLTAFEDICQEARKVQRSGVRYVVVSMGPEGAVGVSDEGTWKAVPPDVQVKSALGAGDSMVAGILHVLASGGDFAEGLRLGSACGAASAMATGTQLAQLEVIQQLASQVQITRLE